ncbi:MAG: Gfo/Idh/MocA family oxidoreductase [Bacilli bacterium]|nr:Gfo/Idh/MocA family oxidoreductase [Bacilli bacterium]
MEEYKIGIIGVGNRGSWLLKYTFLNHDVKVIAVCDKYEDRVESAAKMIEEAGQPTPFKTTDYHELLEVNGMDAVVIATSWAYHIPISIAALEKGIPVGCEVGGAYSLEDCYKLIETCTRTKVPFSMVENVSYGKEELMVLKMVREGLFGEIIHCEGGYRHDLREEIGFGRENRHYRFNEYLDRNRENYPTHELGPINNILNITRGNRYVSLMSTASKSAGMHEFFLKKKGEEYDATNMVFKQGDVVTTLLKTEQGQLVRITLETTLPRPYSRNLNVIGTKGSYCEENKSIFIDGEYDEGQAWNWRPNWGNVDKYFEKYNSGLWEAYEKGGVDVGHGGIDSLCWIDFLYHVKHKLPMPTDVYDSVTMMAVSVLSEMSIKNGSTWVDFPDFTDGKYKERKPWEIMDSVPWLR